jgi:hypothetical protein
MKETNISEAPEAANDDLDAYVASVRAFLAQSNSGPDDDGLSESSTSKSSDQWQDARGAKDPRRLPAAANELAKKHCTKR